MDSNILAIIEMIVGLLAPILIQALKNSKLDLSGAKAQLIILAVSLAIGVGISLIKGFQFTDIPGWFGVLGIVELFYRQFFKKILPTPDNPTP